MITILAILTSISLATTLWQFWAGWRYPLHQRAAPTDFTPSVTLLKPLKGCEPDTCRCLQSWLDQQYRGELQILLGAASPDDPVCPVVEKLLRDNPQAKARLVICPQKLGPNAKVSTLIQLEPLIAGELFIVSDADVLAPPDLLANLVPLLKDSQAGLANCFYRLANPVNLAMRWETVAINADFWSQVLQSRHLAPLDFALGAVMAAPKKRLQDIGGFRAIVDYLADDYQLGHQIHAQGGRIELCPVAVDCYCPPMTFAEVWAHQLRWARTIRHCKPLPYALSLINNSTLWPLLLTLSARSSWASSLLLLALSLRIITAGALQAKLTASTSPWPYAWLAPVKDLFQVALWLLSWIGHEVVWRGDHYRVQTGGKLQQIEDN